MKLGIVAILLVPALSVLAQPGTVDLQYHTTLNQAITRMAAAPDGKTIVVGNFTEIGGLARPGVARLNTDGTVDTNFNTPGIMSGTIKAVAVAEDGTVVLGGEFDAVGGWAGTNVARLNADGSVDTTFAPDAGINGPVNCVASDWLGNVVIGGPFTQIAGVYRGGLARLDRHGRLDWTFNNTASWQLNLTVLASFSGLTVGGGAYTNVNGEVLYVFERLLTDGTIDTWFIASTANDAISCLTVLDDYRYLIGGQFTNLDGQPRSGLARLKSDGSLDLNFVPPSTNGPVRALASQWDGKVLVAREAFSDLVRLGTNGLMDSSYHALSNCTVTALATQTDGKLLVGLDSPPYLLRLHGDSPIVEMEPENQTIAPGGIALFKAQASGMSPLAIQWYKDGLTITGAVSSVFAITNVQPADRGFYWMVVTNLAGAVTSRVAALSYYGEPVVRADGEVVTSAVSRNFSSTVSISSDMAGGYIFYTLDGSEPNYFSPLYAGPLVVTNSTSVRALVLSQDFATTYTNLPARVKILKYPLTVSCSGGGSYVLSPARELYEEGEIVTLWAKRYSYWYFDHWVDGDLRSSSDPLVLTIDSPKHIEAIFTTEIGLRAYGPGKIQVFPPPPYVYGQTIEIRAVPDPGAQFSIWGSDASGTQNPMHFTVRSEPVIAALFGSAPAGTPSILTNPVSCTVSLGGTATFSVIASNAAAYQWRLNGTNLAGATADTLTLTKLQPAQAGEYDVVVSGLGGSVLSYGAQLSLFQLRLRPQDQLPVISLFGSPGLGFRIGWTEDFGRWKTYPVILSALASNRVDVVDSSATNTANRFYWINAPYWPPR